MKKFLIAGVSVFISNLAFAQVEQVSLCVDQQSGNKYEVFYKRTSTESLFNSDGSLNIRRNHCVRVTQTDGKVQKYVSKMNLGWNVATYHYFDKVGNSMGIHETYFYEGTRTTLRVNLEAPIPLQCEDFANLPTPSLEEVCP